MSLNVKIDTLIFRSQSLFGPAFTLRVKVDYPVVESKKLIPSERPFMLTETTFLSAHESVVRFKARVRIKAGPGKGRLRTRDSGTTTINMNIPLQRALKLFAIEDPVKIVGDWILNVETGELLGDVVLDPPVMRTKYGRRVQLLGYTCIAIASNANSSPRRS